jgi:hypothetical protein
MSAGLLYGRTPTSLDRALDADDALFAATRADKWKFSHKVYRHCTFANVSFLEATLENCTFLNCAFVDCYFRKTTINSSVFTGCKFEDCIFTELRLVDSTFTFPTFRGCFIEYRDFVAQLPDDPGFRFKIADELAREAELLGQSSDARLYRLAGASAFEGHLRNIALASGSRYYREHFELGQRIDSLFGFLRRKLNRFLWGYGERGWVLTRSFLVVAVVVFPMLFWLLTRTHLSINTGVRSEPLDLVDYILFSFDNLLNRPGFSAVSFSGTTAQVLVGLEVLVGLLFIGLFISLIFNWMRRR